MSTSTEWGGCMKRRFRETLVGFRFVVLTLLLAPTIASAQVQVTLSSNIDGQTHQAATRNAAEASDVGVSSEFGTALAPAPALVPTTIDISCQYSIGCGNC